MSKRSAASVCIRTTRDNAGRRWYTVYLGRDEYANYATRTEAIAAADDLARSEGGVFVDDAR